MSAAQLRLSTPAAPGTRALASRHWNPAEEPSLATSVLYGQHLRPHPLMESWHLPHTTCVEASASRKLTLSEPSYEPLASGAAQSESPRLVLPRPLSKTTSGARGTEALLRHATFYLCKVGNVFALHVNSSLLTSANNERARRRGMYAIRIRSAVR